MLNEVNQTKDTLEKWKPTSSARQVAASVNNKPVLTRRGTVVSAPPTEGKEKLFYEFLCEKIKNGTS
jgi:hypothetical protein